jgi:dipeptidyl-peptidase-4
MSRLRDGRETARIVWIAVLLLLALAGPAAAQQRLLSLDDIFDPERRIDFSGSLPTRLEWLNDEQFIWARPASSGTGTEHVKVEATSGRIEPLFDRARMQTALVKLAGVTEDEARRLSGQSSYTMNPLRTATLLTIAEDLYYYEFGAETAVRLTFTPGREEEASFSPDGRLVAFVRDNNLFVVQPAQQRREQPLTTDGNAELLNGKLDWVYQEEIYGRGNYSAYWWSPDSSRVAFLQLDERPVPEYTLVDQIPYRPVIETWDYPKAGDPNPTVKLGVVRVVGGPTQWVDVDKYSPIQFLIVNVSWTPDSRQVVFQVQDREQTWLDLNLGDAGSGQVRTLLRETTKAWVNDNGSPTWLKDGSFLWLSERSGWKHAYRYKPDGSLDRQVTSGAWELRTLHGVDEAGNWIYFSGTERSHIGSDVYRVALTGGAPQRLSEAAGVHSANFNPSLSLYLDSWSDVTTPTQVRLHHADGREVRVVDENKVAALGEFRLSKPEFLQVKTRDGFLMEAMMIKPPNFDPSRRYPVYQHTYGGPHAPQVRNGWGGSTYMYHQLLAQKGIIVWVCDNRSASGKGMESTWPVYRNLGELELRDIEDGIAWLKSQPYVDGTRIGLNGWSYGGFMTSYALTHSTSFAMGIAGGTVSDWRDYDTIYTERYMAMPQNNPEGYRKSAPRFAAANLHGRLLLIHGTMDDNVHMQNTLQFVYELQKAQKPFRLMLYPKSRHGVSDPKLVKHMREMMLAFILETLQPDRPAATSTAARPTAAK